MSFPLKILIAPLDWGLGHTSRCLPVIEELQRLGHEVTAAAAGISAALLKANFPDLRLIDLPGYGITYSRKRKGFKLKILLQLPKLLGEIQKEQRWLQREVERYPYDLIISDNRYGLHHPDVHSVIMTHQLQILTDMGKFSESFVRKIHYYLLEKFDRCWVVDKAADGLSGRLAHPATLPRNAQYIGWLSQLAMTSGSGTEPKQLERSKLMSKPLAPETRTSGSSAESVACLSVLPKTGASPVMILLSGPEPMRGLLEEKLWGQLPGCPDRQFIFIAGKPGAPKPGNIPENVCYFSHLTASELKAWMPKVELVICRSGYSTLMDLAAMGKKALLVPTPGQTEQEYLAESLCAQHIALYRTQTQLSLENDLPIALEFKGFNAPEGDFHQEMKSTLQVLPDLLRKPT